MRTDRLTDAELTELVALNAKVSEPDSETGQYPHWARAERDRWCELARKRDPSIRFAPSTEEMARRFGRLSQKDKS